MANLTYHPTPPHTPTYMTDDELLAALAAAWRWAWRQQDAPTRPEPRWGRRLYFASTVPRMSDTGDVTYLCVFGSPASAAGVCLEHGETACVIGVRRPD